VIGRDPHTDLAVLRVDGSSLPCASFGARARCRSGQSHRPSATRSLPAHRDGRVVRRDGHRSTPDPRTIDDVIKTDAALIPATRADLGHTRGEVIGIIRPMIVPAHGAGLCDCRRHGARGRVLADSRRTDSPQLHRSDGTEHAGAAPAGVDEQTAWLGCAGGRGAAGQPGSGGRVPSSDIILSLADQPVATSPICTAADPRSHRAAATLGVLRAGERRSIAIVLRNSQGRGRSSDRAYSTKHPRRTARRTRSVRLVAPSFPAIDEM